MPASVAQVDACPTGDQEIAGSTTLGRQHSFIDINHEIISSVILSLLFVCVEVLRPSQPSGVMSSAVSLPNHTFTGQA